MQIKKDMRKIFLILVGLVPVFVFGQVSENSTYQVKTSRFVQLMTAADTLSCSTSLDTSLWNVSMLINANTEFEYVCAVDSLSGATGATLYLETSMTGGATADEWQIYDTHTINGAGHTEYRTVGKLYGKYIRDRIYAPSSTQSTRLVRTLKYRR